MLIPRWGPRQRQQAWKQANSMRCREGTSVCIHGNADLRTSRGSYWQGGSIMRGRRPVGPEYADQLAGSDIAKLRTKVILETMARKCSLTEACERLRISKQRFHQLREDMMTGAVKALEPG